MDSMSLPLCCARALRARRRAQRGAAFVEALIAISFFIIIFACTSFLGQLYGDKLKMMRQSREAAWVDATRGCSGGGGSNIDDANVDLGSINGAPGTDGLTKGVGQASSTMTAQTKASFVIGGFNVNVTSTTRVACNEQRQDSDVVNIAKYVFGALFK